MVNDEMDAKGNISVFEKKKIENLNKFFMRNVIISLLTSVIVFIVSVVLLVVIVTISNIDMTVKITIISMISTFILTTSKTIIDRLIEIVIFTIRLLGEEQRGLNKKIGIEVEGVNFESIQDDKE